MIAEHRLDVSELGDDDSVFAFSYKDGDRYVLPFFSSEDTAKHFSATAFRADLSVFQTYQLLAAFVAVPGYETFDLILDPRSPSERRFSDEESLLLRRLSTAAMES